MSKIAIVEVDTCCGCPHKDDIGRCSQLDRGVYKDCIIKANGIRDDCPLDESESEGAL